MENEAQISSKFSHSPTIGAIAAALAKASAQFTTVTKGTENTYFKTKYADLSALIEATQKGLAANGLAVIQSPGEISGNKVYLTSMLVHSSGEWFRDELGMPMAKADAQGVGSAVTYARRYSYGGLLSIAGEPDDDANIATGKSEKARESDEQYDQRTEDQKVVMPAQAQAMHDAMKRTGKPEALVTAYLKEKGYKQFEQVLRSDFQTVLKWLNTAQKASGADLTPDLQKSVRDAVNKKLWATTAKKGIPEGDVKTYAYEKFKVDSMTKLSTEQLRDVLEWVNLL